jgi:hypothetical protein
MLEAGGVILIIVAACHDIAKRCNVTVARAHGSLIIARSSDEQSRSSKSLGLLRLVAWLAMIGRGRRTVGAAS